MYSRALPTHRFFFCLISAAECKEKWRKMKPPPSGAVAKKKTCYLENAMDFCLTFIKTSTPPTSGNMPPVPLNSTGDNEVVENAELWKDSASLID